MRTTIMIDDDVAAALEQLRRERSIGLSEAVNELIRMGLKTRRSQTPFRQQSQRIGVQVDVTNVAETLELLEGPTAR